MGAQRSGATLRRLSQELYPKQDNIIERVYKLCISSSTEKHTYLIINLNPKDGEYNAFFSGIFSFENLVIFVDND